MQALSFQRLIGTGAFGSVYLAELEGDRGFRRQVAVKVLHPNHPNANLFMSRVRDEARLLGLLRDEHILEVLGLVTVAGRDAVLMEFVEGLDLNALLEAERRPPPRALAEIGAAVAGALARAHGALDPATGQSLAVVHRDVKPANVMVTARAGVKLLDFGIARARFEARESRTGQHVLGTLNYMAPEYIITGHVTPAADIYGLALTLWEIITGEVYGPPKLQENQHLARLNERLDRLDEAWAPLLPLLRRMLGWTPAARPSADECEHVLLTLAEGLPGPGLRSWATQEVSAALASRPVPEDEAGLVGTRHLIREPGEAEPEPSSSRTPRPPPPPPPAALRSLSPRPVDAPPERSPGLAPPERPLPTMAPALTIGTAPPPNPPPPPRAPMARAPSAPPPVSVQPIAPPVQAVPVAAPPPRTPTVPTALPSAVTLSAPPPARPTPAAAQPPPAPAPAVAARPLAPPSPAAGAAPPPGPSPGPSSPRPPAPRRPPPPSNLAPILGGAVVGIGLGFVAVALFLVLVWLR